MKVPFSSLLLPFAFLFLSSTSFAQGNPNDFYFEMRTYGDDFSGTMVASRMIDGLGFRYYWGTEGLSADDLPFRPSEGARSMIETVDHIYVLSSVIKSTVDNKIFDGLKMDGLSFETKRERTLQNLESASKALQAMSDAELAKLRVRFSSNQTDLPFWNLLNGPIADAINHVGQIITFRRTNGNPINPNISVLHGTVN